MAKSSAKKDKSKMTTSTPTKVNASFATADQDALKPAKDNDSKYQPSENTDIDELPLDPADGLRKLFADNIKDLYWAENHLVKALPKMAKAASSTALQDAVLNHLEETKKHVQRLEQVFELLGKSPQAKKCDAMEGLTMEGEGIIETTDSGTPARNLGIVMASQKVEHYEIASYTSMIKLANKLGLAEIAGILSQTLVEEENSNTKLSQVSEGDMAAVAMA
ncbi:YciE/YciF ferroxidase family protein [Flavitalea sp.]|nr:ferritin-like domain-containing protein [Flavitalea sp.]